MKKHYFRDFYGCTASIAVNHDGHSLLTIRTTHGFIIKSKTYTTERGARTALGMYSDSWTEKKG